MIQKLVLTFVPIKGIYNKLSKHPEGIHGPDFNYHIYGVKSYYLKNTEFYMPCSDVISIIQSKNLLRTCFDSTLIPFVPSTPICTNAELFCNFK